MNSERTTNICIFCSQELETTYQTLSDKFTGVSKVLHSVESCINCGIGQTFPILSQQQISELYSSEFEAFISKNGLLAFLTTRKYRSDIRIIQHHLLNAMKARHTLFEIGAGRGEFLNTARDMGFEVRGVEPGPAGRLAATDLFEIILEDSIAEETVFDFKSDVIVMRHVLEHTSQPIETLKLIFDEALNDAGLLFLKIPRFDSYERETFGANWHGLDIPRHRFHFSKDGIIGVLNDIGFKILFFKDEHTPLDFLRSISYEKTALGHNKKLLHRVIGRLPSPLSIMASQFFVFFGNRGKAGRMVLVVQKITTTP